MVKGRGSCFGQCLALRGDSRGKFGGRQGIGFGRGAKVSECQSGGSSVRRAIGWTEVADR